MMMAGKDCWLVDVKECSMDYLLVGSMESMDMRMAEMLVALKDVNLAALLVS